MLTRYALIFHRSVRWLRPTSLYIAALAVFGMACGALYGDSQSAAARMFALRDGAPQIVAIESFDKAADLGHTGEAMIQAQIDVALPIQVIHRVGLTRHRALAYPVRAATAGKDAPVLGYFYTDGAMGDAEIIDVARLLPDFETVGAVGPIATLNGEIGAPEPLTARIRDVLRDQGQALATPFLAIAIYSDGRSAALSAPRRSPWVVALIAMSLVLLSIGALMSLLLPGIEERDRLGRIAAGGRPRSGVAAEMSGDKGRSRLAPLAPQPTVPRPNTRRHDMWARLMRGGWNAARGGGRFRNSR